MNSWSRTSIFHCQWPAKDAAQERRREWSIICMNWSLDLKRGAEFSGHVSLHPRLFSIDYSSTHRAWISVLIRGMLVWRFQLQWIEFRNNLQVTMCSLPVCLQATRLISRYERALGGWLCMWFLHQYFPLNPLSPYEDLIKTFRSSVAWGDFRLWAPWRTLQSLHNITFLEVQLWVLEKKTPQKKLPNQSIAFSPSHPLPQQSWISISISITITSLSAQDPETRIMKIMRAALRIRISSRDCVARIFGIAYVSIDQVYRSIIVRN